MDFKEIDFEAIQKDLTEFTQERPVEAVLLAFGAGLGLAVMASTRLLPTVLKSVTVASLLSSFEWLKTAMQNVKAVGTPPASASDSLVH